MKLKIKKVGHFIFYFIQINIFFMVLVSVNCNIQAQVTKNFFPAKLSSYRNYKQYLIVNNIFWCIFSKYV